jgi:hypothetical protein
LSNPKLTLTNMTVVVTVGSAAGFERPTPMEVVKVQVCGGDGHPTLPSGILESCAEPRRTIIIN